MSAPFTEVWNYWMNIIPLAVVGTSLLGSGHCVAMCGGLIITVARDRPALIRYHLGRLLGYCTLGALAGLLGSTLWNSSSYKLIPWLSTGAISFGFILLGLKQWRGQPLHLFRLPSQLWQKLTKLGPGITGLLSAFLPCGWLHTFILGALATRSASLGTVYLFLFWAGTLPALSLAPISISKIFQPIGRRVPKLSAILLITIGISSLGLKLMSMPSPETPTECPMHHSSQNASHE